MHTRCIRFIQRFSAPLKIQVWGCYMRQHACTYVRVWNLWTKVHLSEMCTMTTRLQKCQKHDEQSTFDSHPLLWVITCKACSVYNCVNVCNIRGAFPIRSPRLPRKPHHRYFDTLLRLKTSITVYLNHTIRKQRLNIGGLFQWEHPLPIILGMLPHYPIIWRLRLVPTRTFATIITLSKSLVTHDIRVAFHAYVSACLCRLPRSVNFLRCTSRKCGYHPCWVSIRVC